MIHIKAARNIDRRVMNRIGGTLIFMLVLQFAVAILVYFSVALILGFRPHLTGFTPAALWKFYYDFCVKAKSCVLSYPLALFFTASLANGIPFLVFCRGLRVRPLALFSHSKASAATLILYGVTGLGASYLASVLVNLLTSALSTLHIKISSPSFALPKDSFAGSLLMLAAVIFIGPLTEELVFRGLLLRTFRRFGNWFAVIASSFFWAILHGNFVQAIPVFVMGIFFGIMAVKSGSVFPSLIVHTINNALAIIQTLIPKTNLAVLALFGLFVISFIFVSIVLFCVFHKEFRLDRQVPNAASTGVITIMSSWTMIIFILSMLALIALSVKIV